MHYLKKVALTVALTSLMPAAARAQDPINSDSETSVKVELNHGPLDVVPGIATEIQSKVAEVRQSALYKLNDMGQGASPFVPELIKVVDGVHDADREQAIGVLKNIGPDASAAVPILIETLDDKQYLRDRAIEALGAMGPSAKDAIPALLKVIHEGSITSNAEKALAAIGTDSVAPLIENLTDKAPDCRRLCISALTLIVVGNTSQENNEKIISTITKMLEDKDFDVAREACWGLEKIGTPAKSAVPSLINNMNNNSEYIRQFTADALGAIGPSAKDALPALNKALTDEPVRRSAKAAIKKIEKGDL